MTKVTASLPPKTLKAGSTGKSVKELQTELKAAGFDPGPIDGVYGPKTRAAVEAFQKAKHLQVDGVAGQQTIGALDSFESRSLQSATPPSGGTSVSKTTGAANPGAPTSTKPAPRSLNISYASPAELNRLVDTLKASKLSPSVPVFMGSYGISDTESAKVHELANGKYAPIFSLVRHGESYWNQRSVKGASDPSLSGPIPSNLDSLSPAQRQAWGQELGRRMRDDMRSAAKNGTKIDTWQFDEISPTACGSTPKGVALRQFVTGVLQGLSSGRPELGDKPQQGIAYVAHMDQLASQPTTAETKNFWKTLDSTTTNVVAETYPSFAGDPTKMADQWLSGRRQLAGRGGVYADIASKYVVGATPGYRIGPGIGGVVKGQTPRQANLWRDAFLSEAKRQGVTGFGEYNWMGANESDAVATDVVDELVKLS